MQPFRHTGGLHSRKSIFESADDDRPCHFAAAFLFLQASFIFKLSAFFCAAVILLAFGLAAGFFVAAAGFIPALAFRAAQICFILLDCALFSAAVRLRPLAAAGEAGDEICRTVAPVPFNSA